MNVLALSSRDRRTLTAGGAAIIGLLIIARGLPALRVWEQDVRIAAASAADRIGLMRDGDQQLPVLRDTLRAWQNRLAGLDSDMLRGGSPPAAAAELASLLEAMADESRVKISTLQLRADSVSAAPISHVAVRISGIGDVSGLAGLLRAIEGGDTQLVVRELVVSQPEPAAPDTKPENLRIDLLVEGVSLFPSRGHP